VDQLLRHLIENAQGLGAYLTIFGVLVACGLGVPLPEDVSLILGGYLAHIGAARLPVMMAVGFVGILIGDSFIFSAGRRVGSNVGRRGGLIARVVTPEKRKKVEGLFERHGQKIVMIARFMPGVRAVTYFTAGSAGMRYLRFILWDSLAAMASAPVFVFLGYYFGDELEMVIRRIKDGQLVVVGAIAAAAIAYFLIRRRRAARQVPAPVPLPVASAPGPDEPSQTPPRVALGPGLASSVELRK